MFTREEILKYIRNERSEIEKAQREIEAEKHYIATCRGAIQFWEQMLVGAQAE